MRMLVPETRPVTVEEAYAGAHRQRRADRPWVVLTMIASADGAVVVDGSSGALGNATDKAVFMHMHRTADTVLVGAETVRSDRYHALPAHQTLVVVSRSGDLGTQTDELLGAGNTRLAAGDVADIVRDIPGDVCSLEGGPRLNGQMLAADLVDELNLTIAPTLVGGESDRVAVGPALAMATSHWKVAHVCIDDEGYLFVRYLR
jgi:riboflavin biosynthesis pyrimidine reductase